MQYHVRIFPFEEVGYSLGLVRFIRCKDEAISLVISLLIVGKNAIMILQHGWWGKTTIFFVIATKFLGSPFYERASK